MACGAPPAQRPQVFWTSTFEVLAIYSIKKKKTEPWIQLKEEDLLYRTCGFYWRAKRTEQELMKVLDPPFLSILKMVFVICLRLHGPHMEGKGCKEHDLKPNIHRSMFQEEI